MMHFILIAGVFVNVFFVSVLEPNGDKCHVYVAQSSQVNHTGVYALDDARPCTEILVQINKAMVSKMMDGIADD